MKTTNNSPKPSLEQFEAWLRNTNEQPAPDVSERVLQSIQTPQTTPDSNRYHVSVFSTVIGLAAAVVLALFLLPTQNSPQDITETVFVAQSHPVTDLIIDSILLEEAPMDSIVWLLEDDNHFTLASYLPVNN
jgi:hypothetical protein